MRLRRQRHASGSTLAIQHHDTWVPLRTALEQTGETAGPLAAVSDDLIGLLADQGLQDQARHLCERVVSDLPTEETAELLLPWRPPLLRCYLNSRQHWEQAARNMARRYHPLAPGAIRVWEGLTRTTFPPLRPGGQLERSPCFYLGNPLTIYPDGEQVPWPDYCTDMDFELEIGFVVVKPLNNADEKEAEQAIGGFVVFNDLSSRNTQWQEHNDGLFGPVIKTKTFASAMSAEVVTADEVLPHLDSLSAYARVNGEEWSRTSSANLRWSPAEMVAYASKGEQVFPGELLSTGTLPNGCGLELNRWVRPGDRIELEVERIGTVTSVLSQPARTR